MNISQLRGYYCQHYWPKQRADDELHDKTEENDLVPSRNGQFQRVSSEIGKADCVTVAKLGNQAGTTTRTNKRPPHSGLRLTIAYAHSMVDLNGLTPVIHKVEIGLMGTLVYRAKCIVNDASREKKSPIRIVSNAAASAPSLIRSVSMSLAVGTRVVRPIFPGSEVPSRG
jgi:hypothetical protein